jgi:hypothetical protein
MLFNDFTELLEVYVEKNGNIPTTSYQNPTALEFVEEQLKRTK